MFVFDKGAAIDPKIETEILKTLDEIEKANNVKILHAVESGSRAWGFHSPNSDYDVRFFYVHNRDWYLSIYAGRDVIELPINEIYDVSGWDLKKTLHLVMKSNAVVMEWLKSPIIYKSNPKFSDALTTLCSQAFDEKALLHHYINLGTRQIDQIWRTADVTQIKKYFYMLRPAMALRWLEKNSGLCAAPMNIQNLMEESAVPPSIRKIVDDLIERKTQCEEKQVISRVPELDEFMMCEYDRAVSRVENISVKKDFSMERADQFFRQWLF